jgi:hypothetical protein
MKNDVINTFKTINEVEQYREKMNEMCDKRIKFITLCVEAKNLSEKSFGYIKETFEAISPELFKTNEGKKIMKKYTKTIKESKNLSSLHTIYENIRKAGKDMDVDFFVNNIANTKWDIDKSTLKEDTQKLGRVLSEAYLCVGNEDTVLPEENKSLSMAVEYIAENKKTNKNIAEYSNAVKIIKENVISNENSSKFFEAPNTFSEKMIKEFNEKYADVFTETEIKALKEVSCSNDKEVIFNKYKEICSNKIEEAKKNFEAKGDMSSSDRLKVVLEQISSKSFAPETVSTDIYSLMELTKIFE